MEIEKIRTLVPCLGCRGRPDRRSLNGNRDVSSGDAEELGGIWRTLLIRDRCSPELLKRWRRYNLKVSVNRETVVCCLSECQKKSQVTHIHKNIFWKAII